MKIKYNCIQMEKQEQYLMFLIACIPNCGSRVHTVLHTLLTDYLHMGVAFHVTKMERSD